MVELRPCQRDLVEVGGVRREVSVQLIDDGRLDDYPSVHVGFASSKRDPLHAAQAPALFGEAAAQLPAA